MARGGAAANLEVDAAVTALMATMLARTEHRTAPPPKLDDKRLARVVDYVEAHLAEPMTTGELAGIAAVSMFHFTRIFREATGRTPAAYVAHRRVERAKGMLSNAPGSHAWIGMRTNGANGAANGASNSRSLATIDPAALDPTEPASLSQIAFACGFASHSHFGQVFKQHTGMTPGEWREGAR